MHFRKAVLAVAIILCLAQGYVFASEDEKTYTLDEALEKIGQYVNDLDIKVDFNEMYEIISQHFSEPESVITDKEIRSIIMELSEKHREKMEQLKEKKEEKEREQKTIFTVVVILFAVMAIVVAMIGIFTMRDGPEGAELVLAGAITLILLLGFAHMSGLIG